MKIEIIANCEREETRIALIEDGKLTEFFWERKTSPDYFLVGNIYKGRVTNVLPGMDAAFVDIGHEKNAYLYITDVLMQNRGKPIETILKKDDFIMVQVIKETIGTKGMKISMNISLPGRFMVLTPLYRQVLISKQIEDSKERDRLSEIVGQTIPTHLGSIVRTEAEGASREALRSEAKYLLRVWENIGKKYDHTESPRVLYKELDLPLQIARDLLSEDVTIYLVDSPDVYRELTGFITDMAPHLRGRIALYDKKTPIFSAFSIESELAKMRRSHIPLKSGGMIIIQETESTTMVDVNTGRFVGATTQEETVTQTNIEAAHEVAHQLRLRNIGGIIVIDFIDMKKETNRRKVLETFREALHRDRAKVKIHPITRLGLIEMTRERKRESNLTFLTEACEVCQGSGRMLSKETLLLKIGREANNLLGGRSVQLTRLQMAPSLAKYMRENLARLERLLQPHPARLLIQEDQALGWEDYKIILE